jgi:peptidoglycan/LPS O-acetylase OafA/YrhL
MTQAEQVWRVTLALVAAAFLILPCAFAEGPPGPVRRFVTSPVVDTIGAWSYGIYLWHLLVLNEVSDRVDLERATPLLFAVLLIATLAITLPLAALTYYWVERPAIDLSRRLTRRKVGAATIRSNRVTATAPATSIPR